MNPTEKKCLEDIIENITDCRDLWDRNKNPEITTPLGKQYAQGTTDAYNHVLTRLKELGI